MALLFPKRIDHVRSKQITNAPDPAAGVVLKLIPARGATRHSWSIIASHLEGIMRKNSSWLLVLSLAVVSWTVAGVAQAPAKEAPKAAKSPSAEVLDAWNDVGGRL